MLVDRLRLDNRPVRIELAQHAFGRGEQLGARAGTHEATSATRPSTTGTPRNVSGSSGGTPCRSLDLTTRTMIRVSLEETLQAWASRRIPSVLGRLWRQEWLLQPRDPRLVGQRSTDPGQVDVGIDEQLSLAPV